jgi:maleylpyruvate isomerase
VELNGGVTDSFATTLELVHHATQSTVQTVDGLTDSQWAEPSVLPGWTRGHVIAHLTNHAEGLARAVRGLRVRRPVPIYDSNEARDGGIERLARQRVDVIRELFLASVTDVYDALRHITPSLRDLTVERTPGGQVVSAEELVLMRWREVEIHHADLDAGFTHQDWSPEFVDYFLPLVSFDRAEEVDLSLVHGAPASMAWWLAGRGNGEGILGQVPSLGPWTRRTPAK